MGRFSRTRPRQSARDAMRRAEAVTDINQQLGGIANGMILHLQDIARLAKKSRFPLTPAQRALNRIHAIAAPYLETQVVKGTTPVPKGTPYRKPPEPDA